MEIKCNENHKRVMKKALKVVSSFNVGDFTPYIDALSQNIPMSIDLRMNVEHSMLIAQAMLNEQFEDKNIKLNDYGVNILSSYKKVGNNDFNFSKDELTAISVASEAYARIGMGQINYCRDLLMNGFHDDQLPIDKFGKVAECFDIANRKLDCSFGIHNDNVSEDVRTSWDIYQVVRNFIAWDREPNGGITVNFDLPMRVSKEPLIEIGDYKCKEKNSFTAKKIKPKF